MYYNEDILIEGEAEVVQGTLIKKVEQVEKEFKVSFDFYHSGNTGGSRRNLVHFTTQDTNKCVDGHYVPGVWCCNSQLRIESSVNGNSCYQHCVNFTPNAWHSVSISQEQVGNDFVYSITFDGKNIHEVINTKAKVYQDVKIYVSDPWYVSSSAKIRNLKLCNGTKVDPDLQCPHCQQMFSDPMLLDCGETLCRNCVKKLVGDGLGKIAACPVCKMVITVQDTTSLWKNLIIQRKVDAVKLRKGGGIKCSDCVESAAKEFCLDCKSPFCGDCADHHRKRAPSKTHKLDDMANVSEDLQPPAVPLCTQHKKLIEYFCEQCRAATCVDCTRSKIHRGHDMLLMDEVMEEELTSLNERLAEIHIKWDQYEKYIADIETFMNKATEKQERSRLVIQETFQKIQTELRRAEEETLKLFDEPHEAAMDELKRAKDSFIKGKGKTKYIAELSALPSYGSSEGVSDAKKWMEETSKQVQAVLLNGNLEEGNFYNVARGLISSCEVTGTDDAGARVVDKMLEYAKKISFHRTVVPFDADDPSGTF